MWEESLPCGENDVPASSFCAQNAQAVIVVCTPACGVVLEHLGTSWNRETAHQVLSFS